MNPPAAQSASPSPPVPDALPARAVRFLWRVVKFACVTVGALADGAFGRARPEDWMHRWGANYCRALNWRFTVTGTPPQRGLLVCNHLSYVDIVVLAAAGRTLFVAKSEVRGWPVFGWLARLGGTIFVVRGRRMDVARVNAEMQTRIAAGRVLTIFPEGTSSGGASVLPFHAPLLAPAAEGGWPVTPAWIGYALADGDPAVEVCYWKDMTFAPHLLNLLTKRRVDARLAFGEPRGANPDRKALAKELHAAVLELRARAISR